MELEIVEDKVNPVLKRREVSLRIKSKTTPSRIEVKNKLAAMLDSKPELIVIKKLRSVFGKQETIGRADIYEDEEQLKRFAQKHLLARDARLSKAEEAEAKSEDEVKEEEKKEEEKEEKEEEEHEAEEKVDKEED